MAGIFKKLSGIFKSQRTDQNLWFYVQCDHCKEILRGRIDIYNHLSIVYGETNGDVSYYCRKVVIGSKRCFRSIEVEFTFNAKREVVDRQVKGGKIVTEDAFLQY